MYPIWNGIVPHVYPIYEFLHPIWVLSSWQPCLDARHLSLKVVNRLVIGMFLSSMSMCITGIVEVLRQYGCNTGRILNEWIIHFIVCRYVLDSDDSSLSVYAQLPQNIFIGFSQLFTVPASYEYAYLGAPLSAQSLFISLHFCSIGVSLFLTDAYIDFFPYDGTGLDFKVGVQSKRVTLQNLCSYTDFS